MLLYTTASLEAVFPPKVDYSLSYKQIPGGYMEMMKLSSGQTRVNRLISTDLKMYLNNDYSPR